MKPINEGCVAQFHTPFLGDFDVQIDDQRTESIANLAIYMRGRVMEPHLTIRAERPQDQAAIAHVITAAFLGMPYADGDEAELVDALRNQDALSVSLVAEIDGAVVGHIAFSPAQAVDNEEGWYALGPVAVLPEHQRTGIGSRLVLAGLLAITALDAKGCILVGHPEYYMRFGFLLSASNAPIGQPSDFFMVKSLGSPIPSGPIAFHKAFNSAA